MSSNEATTTTESAPTKTKRARKASKSTASAKESKSKIKKAAKTKSGAKRSQKPAAATAESKERANTKKAIVLEMLRRKEGATTAEIAKATNWQNHTIRGLISGTVTKKMGLPVESVKNEAGERTYRIAE